MRILGLILTLLVSIGIGVIYWQSRTWDSQGLPEAYKVLEDLEQNGIYQNSDIQIETLEGQKLNLHSFKGKIVILSFWATWCEPCVEEFPSFIKLLDKFPDKVVVIAISHDSEKKDVREFVDAFKGMRKNLILTLDSGKKISEAFRVDRLPEGFVFSGEGKLLKKIIGIQDWASPSALEYFQSI
jgi:thiol-disulfide isomerase/thioredoxin